MLEIRQTEKVMSGKMSGKMSEKILDLIMYNSKITTNELAENLGVSTKTIERAVKLLKVENQIKRIGGRKEGYWQVIEG
jgi:ATP-dependent DNA helicase RecG